MGLAFQFYQISYQHFVPTELKVFATFATIALIFFRPPTPKGGFGFYWLIKSVNLTLCFYSYYTYFSTKPPNQHTLKPPSGVGGLFLFYRKVSQSKRKVSQRVCREYLAHLCVRLCVTLRLNFFLLTPKPQRGLLDTAI